MNDYQNRTKMYFTEVMNYMNTMKEYQDEEASLIASMEKYKGSAGYDDEVKQIKAERKRKVKDLQADSLRKLLTTIDGMRDAAKSRPLTPPTPEQEAILRLLSMKKTLTRDELDQAENSLASCPLAIDILSEIAQQHDLPGYRTQRPSVSDILRWIDNLEGYARTMTQMPMVNGGTLWTANTKYHAEALPGGDAYRFIQTDRFYETEDGCISRAGFIDDSKLSVFKKAVNGKSGAVED